MTDAGLRRITFVALLFGALAVSSARAADPKVPPGKASDGIPVAVLSTGIDYTQPEIAAGLARDGEGELIGWDFADGDRTPYAASPNATPAHWGGDGTALAKSLLSGIAASGTRHVLIPVRIDPGKPLTFAQALAFVAQTPAKMIIVPMWSEQATDWEGFTAAATHFKDLQILGPACSDRDAAKLPPVYPLALNLPNVNARPADSSLKWADTVVAKPCS